MSKLARIGVVKAFRPALTRDRRPRDMAKDEGRKSRALVPEARASSAPGPECGDAPFLAQLIASRTETAAMRRSRRMSAEETIAVYADARARIASGHQAHGPGWDA